MADETAESTETQDEVVEEQTTLETTEEPEEQENDGLSVLRAENQRLKREAAQREQERRKAEREAKKAEDARKAEQGEWKKLAEERLEQVQALEGKLAERDRLDAERTQRDRVTTIADKLNFHRPKRAFALLVDELGPEQAADTLSDEQLTEAALRRLAKNEPELINQQRRSGAPVSGTRGNGQPDPARELSAIVDGLLGPVSQ